ncbi:maleylpyruvate isomerase family mycothiol-dependent enzyme [Luteipulveratus sp. YIM 133132]|uniref:maleylpyruvate isomerase family mycothiol-dependent enzyme n=1 Tax=Luteipulveratus flavus TaxID=3031728 RepID=UPI0023B10FD6|nr:maleylpyruvate isomerase family mycothiol-dependent enzyme [Luteipulveratus sp. YIM 133132]MDE9366396.1 maleylpyruvate isomerase family mycothiol-dependent enzyme [Luteipulveratus sp. YIM 133132]
MDLQPLVGDTFARLADLLEANDVWDRPSLCEGWRVREVVAHVTMPARMTPEQYGAEIAAAGGDFQTMSDAVAARDASLPVEEHLANLRSNTLAAWQPPGGGALGALNHAVVHALDVTNAAGLERAPGDDATVAILDGFARDGGAARFGVAVDGLALRAADLDWAWGDGSRAVSASSGELVSLLSHRTLTDGTTLA